MFQPVIPAAGLSGWRFLQRTYDSQSDTFNASPQIIRDTDYFRDKFSSITSAEDLVADRRLLSVALGAFGLQDDINNRFFIRKVLEEGTTSEDPLANRLSDSRYRALAKAFSFGPTESSAVSDPAFAGDIVARYQATAFEIAAGNQDGALRIGLYAQRTLPDLADRDMSNDAKWFTILGDPPMRDLFEKALNLPASIGQIDIDQQLGVFKEKARRQFGTDDLSSFGGAEIVQDVITKFMVRDQLRSISNGLSSTAIALSLLQR